MTWVYTLCFVELYINTELYMYCVTVSLLVYFQSHTFRTGHHFKDFVLRVLTCNLEYFTLKTIDPVPQFLRLYQRGVSYSVLTFLKEVVLESYAKLG